MEYQYNGDGDRVGQTTKQNNTLTSTITYVLDTAAPLTMVLSETTDGVTTTYWQGLDVLAQKSGSDVSTFAYDGLGVSPPARRYQWATPTCPDLRPLWHGYSKSGSATRNLGFAGEQQDSIVFLRARYYNPTQGRFFQTDPSRQEINPYQFGIGNPVMYIDPSGMDSLVMLPIIKGDTSGMVLWEGDWYGHKAHRYAIRQANA